MAFDRFKVDNSKALNRVCQAEYLPVQYGIYSGEDTFPSVDDEDLEDLKMFRPALIHAKQTLNGRK